MRMDTRIPLLGQTPDIVGNLSRGQSAADLFNQQKAAQTERVFLRDYGEALSAGDPGALQAYAGINLEGSMALKSHFEAKRRAQAAQATAAAKAAQADELRKVQAGVDALSVVYGEAESMSEEERAAYFNKRAREIAGSELVDKLGLTYDNFVPLATRLSGEMGLKFEYETPEAANAPVIETFYDVNGNEVKKQWDAETESWVAVGGSKAPKPAEVKFPYKIPPGYMLVNPNNPAMGVMPLTGFEAPAPVPKSIIGKINADYNAGLISEEARDASLANVLADDKEWTTVTEAERVERGWPEGFYQIGPNNEVRTIGQGGVNVHVGDRETAFQKEAGKGAAAQMVAVSAEGIEAIEELISIDRLENLLKETPTGLGAEVVAKASRWGIKLDGADQVEAVMALLNKLTPAQRGGLPGSATERDVQMFRDSLPKLINTPEGNRLIVETLRNAVEYKIEAGIIADKVLGGEMSPPDGKKAIRKIPSVIDGAKVKMVADGLGPSDVNPYLNMTEGQLLNLDIDAMTDEQVDLLNEAWGN